MDLDRRLKIPVEIADTNSKPQIILTLRSSKRIKVNELTVPIEERIEVLSELKKTSSPSSVAQMVMPALLSKSAVPLAPVVGSEGTRFTRVITQGNVLTFY